MHIVSDNAKYWSAKIDLSKIQSRNLLQMIHSSIKNYCIEYYEFDNMKVNIII